MLGWFKKQKEGLASKYLKVLKFFNGMLRANLIYIIKQSKEPGLGNLNRKKNIYLLTCCALLLLKIIYINFWLIIKISARFLIIVCLINFVKFYLNKNYFFAIRKEQIKEIEVFDKHNKSHYDRCTPYGDCQHYYKIVHGQQRQMFTDGYVVLDGSDPYPLRSKDFKTKYTVHDASKNLYIKKSIVVIYRKSAKSELMSTNTGKQNVYKNEKVIMNYEFDVNDINCWKKVLVMKTCKQNNYSPGEYGFQKNYNKTDKDILTYFFLYIKNPMNIMLINDINFNLEKNN